MIAQLQKWYYAQCNEDWEHTYGVTIETIDNPGWSVEIDLSETELEDKPFVEIVDIEPELDWIRCWVKDKKFYAAGGPKKLEEILNTFLKWARE